MKKIFLVSYQWSKGYLQGYFNNLCQGSMNIMWLVAWFLVLVVTWLWIYLGGNLWCQSVAHHCSSFDLSAQQILKENEKWKQSSFFISLLPSPRSTLLSGLPKNPEAAAHYWDIYLMLGQLVRSLGISAEVRSHGVQRELLLVRLPRASCQLESMLVVSSNLRLHSEHPNQDTSSHYFLPITCQCIG